MITSIDENSKVIDDAVARIKLFDKDTDKDRRVVRNLLYNLILVGINQGVEQCIENIRKSSGTAL